MAVLAGNSPGAAFVAAHRAAPSIQRFESANRVRYNPGRYSVESINLRQLLGFWRHVGHVSEMLLVCSREPCCAWSINSLKPTTCVRLVRLERANGQSLKPEPRS